MSSLGESVTDVVSLNQTRVVAGVYSRVPETILFLLLAGSALSLGMVGYGAGLDRAAQRPERGGHGRRAGCGADDRHRPRPAAGGLPPGQPAAAPRRPALDRHAHALTGGRGQIGSTRDRLDDRPGRDQHPSSTGAGHLGVRDPGGTAEPGRLDGRVAAGKRDGEPAEERVAAADRVGPRPSAAGRGGTRPLGAGDHRAGDAQGHDDGRGAGARAGPSAAVAAERGIGRRPRRSPRRPRRR